MKEKAKTTAALRKLKPLADEINHRMKKGEENVTAVKLQFAAAQKICKQAGIPWQKWAEENLKYSIQYINRCIKIETDQDPAQAKLAHKKKHAEEEKARRAKAKATGTHVGSEAVAAGPSRSKFEIADDMLAGMTDQDQLSVARSRVEKLGFRVVPSDDLKALQAKAKGKPIVAVPDAKSLMTSFLAMKASDKICDDNSIPWQKWAEENLDWKLSRIKELQQIAAHPEGAAQGQIEQKAKSRTRARRSAEAAAGRAAQAAGSPGGPKKTGFTLVAEQMATLSDSDQVNVARASVEKLGFRIVPKDDLKMLWARAKSEDPEKELLTHRKKGAARQRKSQAKLKNAVSDSAAAPKKSTFTIADHRARKRTKLKTPVSHGDRDPAAAKKSSFTVADYRKRRADLRRSGGDAKAPKKKSPFTIADEYLAGLDEKTQHALDESRAPYTMAIRATTRRT